MDPARQRRGLLRGVRIVGDRGPRGGEAAARARRAARRAGGGGVRRRDRGGGGGEDHQLGARGAACRLTTPPREKTRRRWTADRWIEESQNPPSNSRGRLLGEESGPGAPT